ncbi:MAG: SRPBCC family protein [Alphaproteobacteria bacterium]|nr:SRPBCC family protein [Alphaproteobacteria bacterium]
MVKTTQPDTVYVTYIATTPKRCWTALTQSKLTSQFFFGRTVESSWQKGSPWILRKPDGGADVRGVVLESDPPNTLVLSWNIDWLDPKPPECLVTYLIEPVGDEIVRLTMKETHPTPVSEHLLEGGRRGWPMILSGLKSLLETGQGLAIPTPSPPEEPTK